MSDQEKKPMSIEEAGNYIRHKDFHEDSLNKIKKLKEEPLGPEETTAATRLRLLRISLSLLSNKGIEGVCKKLLACKVRGATNEQIATALKITPEKVALLEADGMKRVKEKISARAVLPVVM